MSGGYNHYWWCECPFCVHRRHAGQHVTVTVRKAVAAYSSLVNPNARCPVCGDPVYFYQSPEGGRVFFDELGPPWPKHPCTDSRLAPGFHTVKEAPVSRAPAWVLDGWKPLQVVKMSEGIFTTARKKVSDWWVLLANQIDSRFPGGWAISLLTDGDLELPRDKLVYLSPWNERGTATLSWLTGPDAVVVEHQVWRRSRYEGVTIGDAQKYEQLAITDARLMALRESITPRSKEGQQYFHKTRSRKKIALDLNLAILDAQRDGWQDNREDDRRVRSAIAETLGYWNREWVDRVLAVARALY